MVLVLRNVSLTYLKSGKLTLTLALLLLNWMLMVLPCLLLNQQLLWCELQQHELICYLILIFYFNCFQVYLLFIAHLRTSQIKTQVYSKTQKFNLGLFQKNLTCKISSNSEYNGGIWDRRRNIFSQIEMCIFLFLEFYNFIKGIAHVNIVFSKKFRSLFFILNLLTCSNIYNS